MSIQPINKDAYREILFNTDDDRELLEKCSVNKYFYNEVCNNDFFYNRLKKVYPNILVYKPDNLSWRKFFLKVVFFISKMKEDYNYTYSEGDFEQEYYIFKDSGDTNNKLLVQMENDNNRLLYVATKRGNLPLIVEALKRGVDQKYKDFALSLASEFGDIRNVKYLIDSGANITWETLGYASNIEIAKFLISLGADIHANDESPIKYAAQKGHFEVVKFLIESGVNPNDILALSFAAKNDHLEILKYLLSFLPFDINRTNQLFLNAVKGGNIETVKYLLDLGADIHYSNDSSLTTAINNGYFNLVKFLIERGIEFDSRSLSLARKVLEYPLAMFNKNYDKRDSELIVQYLVERGANDDRILETIRNKINRGVRIDFLLQTAIKDDIPLKVIKYIVERGGNIHANNNLALKYARSIGNPETIKYLESL